MKTAESKNAKKNVHLTQMQHARGRDTQQQFFSGAKIPTKSFFNSAYLNTMIQPKLTVGEPGDKYEVEADAMADKVVQTLQLKTNGEVPFFSNTHGNAQLQTKCAECAEEGVQRKEDDVEEEPIQTKLRSQYAIQAKGEGVVTDAGLEQQLNSSKGGGRSMSDPTRNTMESSFGTDFSSVRIHTGSRAVQMNKNLSAQAFTHGNDVYFNQGKYSPETTSGQHLLAHELTHVVQQTTIAGNAIQRQIDANTLRARISDLRTENLMILYVDSFRRDRESTPFYERRSGGASRAVFSDNFIRNRRNRNLIFTEFRGAIAWLVDQHRWEVLHWLYTTFPERYIPNAPSRALQTLRSFIHTTSEEYIEGDRTGWQRIQEIPGILHERAQENHESAVNQAAIAQEAGRTASSLAQAFVRSTGERPYRIVFGTSIGRGIGGHQHGLPNNWVRALINYIRIINQLRKGSTPEVVHGASETIHTYIHGRAILDFNNLTDIQRAVLSNQELWINSVRPRLWRTLRSRFAWGTARAGMPMTIDSFENGRYRFPGQGLD